MDYDTVQYQPPVPTTTPCNENPQDYATKVYYPPVPTTTPCIETPPASIANYVQPAQDQAYGNTPGNADYQNGQPPVYNQGYSQQQALGKDSKNAARVPVIGSFLFVALISMIV